MRRCLSLLFLLVTALPLLACGAPIFRSDAEKFAPAPEIIDQVRPYLDRWATLPADQTQAERNSISSKLNVGIGVGTWYNESTGSSIPVVQIQLYQWGGYSRGYIYVHDTTALEDRYKWELRRVDDHLYLYNSNE